MRLDIIELQVHNWKRMVEWYEKELGFTVRFREDDHQFALLSKDDGAMLSLYGAEVISDAHFTPYMKVEDIKIEFSRLKNAGINIDEIEERHWGKRAKVTDPEGHVFYIYEERRTS